MLFAPNSRGADGQRASPTSTRRDVVLAVVGLSRFCPGSVPVNLYTFRDNFNEVTPKHVPKKLSCQGTSWHP